MDLNLALRKGSKVSGAISYKPSENDSHPGLQHVQVKIVSALEECFLRVYNQEAISKEKSPLDTLDFCL